MPINLVKDIEKILNDKRFLLGIGGLARTIIIRRVKSGFGVNNDTAKDPIQVKLKSLSAGYIKRRTKVRLGEFGKPKRSNLTFTGELLNSILVAAFSIQGIRLTINRKMRRDGMTNEEVAYWVGIDRPWFALTVSEQRVIANEIEKYLRTALRRI